MERLEPKTDISKRTLFCPNCAFRDAIDGEWLVYEQFGWDVYSCPACGTSITRRPRDGSRSQASPLDFWLDADGFEVSSNPFPERFRD